jgi:hypothetical protein
MGTAHLAVHGFLLREAVFSQSGFDRKNKNHNQSRCGRKYTFRNERSGEEKLRGQFSERCPWFTFLPAVLADFLTGDNRRGIAGVGLPDQQADGRERDSPAGLEKAEVAALLQALRQDMLEEAAETLQDIALGGTEAGTAPLPVGARHRAVLRAAEPVMGAGDLEDRGGQGGEGGGAVVVRLPGDMPGEGPALRLDVLQQASVVPLFLAQSTVDGGEGCEGDQKVAPGRPPGGAILGETSPRDEVVEGGVGLEWPAPGGQDAGAPRPVGPEEALVSGEPLEGRGRGVEPGLRGGAVVRAEEGT